MAAVNVKSLKKENDALKVQIENLTASMQKLEENLNVKLIGIPEMNQHESANETTNICCNLFNKIGVKVNESDIDISHRVPGRKAKPGPKPIICKLVRGLTKEHIMKVRKNVSELKASDIGLPTDSALRHALILDHLTPQVQSLLGEAKKIQARDEYKFCWVKNVKIYLRKEENSGRVD